MQELLEHLRSNLPDRYDLQDAIGHGGATAVFRGWDAKHDRAVVIKALRPELAAVLATERFLRSITLAAKLQHPHIVPIYDLDHAGDLPFFVMPFVEGDSLKQRIAREGPLAVATAIEVAHQVADGLAYAHEHDVLHRDITPANILLEGDYAMIADFGLARAITAAGGERLTPTGIVVGTPAYASPEQASANPTLDGRTDVYSLGCVLYEMLVARPPFNAPTITAMLRQHQLAPPPPLRIGRPEVPAWLEQVVDKALAKKPKHRYRSAAEMSAALVHSRGPT